MANRILYILVFVFCAFTINAQNANFFKTYGGNGSDYGTNVISSFSKTYTIVGATESFGNGSVDLYLLNLDSLGNYKWSRTFGGPNIEWGYDLVQTADSGYVICGYSNSFTSGYDSYLIKTTKLGNLIWQKTVDFSSWNFLYSLTKTSDSNYVCAGEIFNSQSGYTEGLAIKFDQNGDTLWSKKFGNAKNNRFNSVMESSTGDLVFTGMTEFDSEDVWIVKTTNNGDFIWEYTFGDTLNDEGNDVIETFDGRYLITGKFGNHAAFGDDHLILKVNSDGTPYLYNYFNESNIDYGVKSFQFAGNQNSISIGTTKSIGQGGFDFRVSLDNQYLGGIWNYAYVYTAGRNNDDIAYSADTTYDGGIVIVGTTTSTNFGPTNIMVFKKDSTTNFPNFSGEVFDLNVAEKTPIKVKYYPNPSQGIITFENELIYNTHYLLYDITGRVVQSGNLVQNQIAIHELKSGTYLLFFTDFNTTVKIQKE